VDDAGLRIPAGWETGLDIYFDDARVWSVDPSYYRANADGSHTVSWPELLRRFLNGRSRVRIEGHRSGEALFDDEYDFGDGDGRVRVVDGSGRPLAIDKWGFINRPFDMQDPALADSLLDDTRTILDFLTERFGLPAFLAYGTLLGAVRAGRLIGHDNDIDIAYFSSHQDPIDLMQEAFRVQRELRREGWRVLKRSGGFFTLTVRQEDGTARNVDVYACFYVGDMLHLVDNVRAALPRTALMPLGSISLEGRTFPAPADPESLLAATYGAGWRVPDPSFRYQIPQQTRRRFQGWFGPASPPHYRRWQRLYTGKTVRSVPEEPSPFALWFSQREPREPLVIDVGTGNGRDAVWLAQRGYEVLGLDYAPAGIARASARGASRARFRPVNLYDLRETLATGARLARESQPKIVYARLVLNALTDEGRAGFWRLVRMALHDGDRLYLEFRTDQDAREPHEFGNHFRRYLPPEVVVDELKARHATVLRRDEGRGLASLGEEDPHICRLVARWHHGP
jgi:SAM-dependent methyltransferase